MNLAEALETLRSTLLKLHPSGASGFEGLAAEALSAVSGLTFRLAKAGFQGGRDASSSPSDAFAIGFEAKRYSDDLSLEDLAGKAVLAGVFLGGKVDVWAVGATAEIGETIVSTLAPMLEERGVTLLLLDWPKQGLPPLAVLMAAAKPRALAWLARHAPHSDAGVLGLALDVIASDPAFATQVDILRSQITASTVGLDALRAHTARWLDPRFSQAVASREAFGQPITVAAPDAPALPRSEQVAALNERIVVDPTDPPVVAVLGGEGAGKTWLVAQWWRSQPNPPILVLVAGRRRDLLDPTDPLRSLARLLAQQAGRTDEAALESWLRRLERWKEQGASERLRFVIVLDGLNERGQHPWAELILGLSLQAQALGGVLVVTCREAFWNRDVAPRLSGAATPAPVFVGDYTDVELAAQLARVQRSLGEFPAKVQAFIRNPRICALALAQLDRLSPDALSVEGLLLEYWRARLGERADGLRHNVSEFHNLIKAHARAWLEAPRRTFDRADWTEHSGPARRLGPTGVADDLTEIEEGRFLNPSSDDPETYSFRPEALPFALGLLINAELKAALAEDQPIEHALDLMLDPVRGFDQISEVLGAATVLACADPGFPAAAARALIRQWLALQNLSSQAYETMAAALLARPDAFFDIMEMSKADLGDVTVDLNRLVSLLLRVREAPAVQAAFAERHARWLGAWSRTGRPEWGQEQAEKRQTARDQHLAERFEPLRPSERELLGALTYERPEPAELPLDWTAALMMAGQPQAAFARGVAGWALVESVAGDYPDGRQELEWSVRLNTRDWPQTRDAVTEALDGVTQASSPPMREGLAVALRLLGDTESAKRAEAIWPASIPRSFRRADRYADVDPYDPRSDPPSDLSAARAALASLKPTSLWRHMSTTGEDLTLEEILPVLARFDRRLLSQRLNAVARQAATRTGLPLRQLSWHLPWLAPLLDARARAAVLSATRALIANPERAPKGDVNFVLGQLVSGILPTLDGEAQLDLLLELPADMPLYLHLRRGARSIDGRSLAKRLKRAKAQGSQGLLRVLFHASASRAMLTPSARKIVLAAMFSDDRPMAASAADVAFRAEDKTLNRAILKHAAARNSALDPDAFAVARAIAVAVVQEARPDLIRLVSPRFLDWVARRLGDPVLDRLHHQTEAVLQRLVEPVAAKPPVGVDIYYATLADDLEAQAWAEDAPTQEPSDDPSEAFRALADAEASARRFSERQREMRREVEAYKAELSREGAEALASLPPRAGLSLIAARDREVTASWLLRILAVTDPHLRAQLKNLAVAIASSHASHDDALAAAVFAAYDEVDPITRVVVDAARLPYDTRALFAAGAAPKLDSLRRQRLDRALDDGEIETVVACAEAVGPVGWLDGYVESQLARTAPSAIARALTVAGLRTQNPQSDELLARDWGGGFLGAVNKSAHAAYAEGVHGRAWLSAWKAARTPLEGWSAAQLLEGVADRRTVAAFEAEPVTSALAQSYGADVFERVRKAAEKRTKDRAGTLFGRRAPDVQLTGLLRGKRLDF